MKLPKYFRKKQRGRYVGNYRAVVRGVEVNLGTKDAEVARQRLREALRTGRRKFTDDVDAAATAMDTDGGEGSGVEAPGVSSPPSATPSPPLPPSPPAAPALQPDAYIPPGAAPSSTEGPEGPDDMAAAAAEVAGSGPGAGAGGTEAGVGGDDFVAGLIDQGAEMLVVAQLGLQAMAVKRWAGADPPVVEINPQLKEAAVKAWRAQLEVWLPRDIPLPPWVVAIAVPAIYIPAQVAGARAAKAAADEGKAPA